MNAIEEILIQQQRRAVHVGSDFVEQDSLAAFSTIETGTATAALATGASAVGGKVLLSTAAVATQDTYVYSQEVFSFSAGGTLVAEAKAQYAEANTEDAIVMFGIMSGVAADAILDGAGGPAAAYSGALIYKVDGSTLWAAEASTDGGANQSGGTSTATAGGAAAFSLRIECHPLTATRMDVSFLIDPAGGSNFVALQDTNLIPLKYEMNISTVSEMSLVFGIKAGAGGTAETLLLDKMDCVQIR